MLDTDFDLPADFVRRITGVYGGAGVDWLRRLPAIVSDCARRWELQVEPHFEPLTYNYVAPALRTSDTAVVLKAGYPDRGLRGEIEALRLFDGHGIARLLDSDADAGVMLLQRLQPGTMLRGAASTDDERATLIAADVMQRLWRPLPPEHLFPTAADWGMGFARLRQRFGGGSGPLPAALFRRAESLFDDLLASSAPPVLLHGDLHHDNILLDASGKWLAIDPKGLAGEPAYETGALLRNPPGFISEHPQPRRALARRLNLLAGALNMDRQRMRDWGIAQALLSTVWTLEDHGHVSEEAIACAEHLVAL